MPAFTAVKDVSEKTVMDIKTRQPQAGPKSASFGGVVKRILAQDKRQQENNDAASETNKDSSGGSQPQKIDPAAVASKQPQQKTGVPKIKAGTTESKDDPENATVVAEASAVEIPAGVVELPVQIPADCGQKQQAEDDAPAVDPNIHGAAILTAAMPTVADNAIPFVEVKNAGDAVILTVTDSSATGDSAAGAKQVKPAVTEQAKSAVTEQVKPAVPEQVKSAFPAQATPTVTEQATPVDTTKVTPGGVNPGSMTLADDRVQSGPAGKVQLVKGSSEGPSSPVPEKSQQKNPNVKNVPASTGDTVKLDQSATSTVVTGMEKGSAVAVAAGSGDDAGKMAVQAADNPVISRDRPVSENVNAADLPAGADKAAGIVEGVAAETGADKDGDSGSAGNFDSMVKDRQAKTAQNDERAFQVGSRKSHEANQVAPGVETVVQPAGSETRAPADPFVQGAMNQTGLSEREMDKYLLNARRQDSKGGVSDGLSSSTATAEPRVATATRELNASGMVDHMMKRVASLQDVVDKFDKMLLSLTSGRDTGMIVHLVPPNLGKLTINCQESGTDLSLNIIADSAFARGFLLNNEQAIREVAANSGFKLSDFDVSTRSEDGSQRRFAGDQEVFEQGRSRKVAGKEVPASVAGVNAENWPEINRNGGLWFVA